MRNGKRGAYVMNPSGGWVNQTLLKDCGIIPYLLYKNHGFHSVMVGSEVEGETYPYLEKYVRGLEMDFLPDKTLQTKIAYMNAHAADIDLLILYGAYPVYIPIVDFYRQVRPDGKIYLATDMNIGWGSRITHNHPDYKRFIKSCDVVAASCRSVQKYLSAKWRVPIELIRNGWYNFPQVSFDNLFKQKENIILTVGRIGTDQKRNEDTLAAFAKVADDLPDWKLRLVGTIEENFKPYMENFFAEYPNLRERVIFTGLIEDKTALMEEYKRAKIFCLTSTFEGFPNVVAEALFAGDFIIFSNFDAALEATDDGKHAVEYARRNFDAEHIVAKLYYLLYGGGA